MPTYYRVSMTALKTSNRPIALLKALQSWGIKYIFATPHVIAGTYENTRESIDAAYKILEERRLQEGIEMKIHYSAEYRMDEHFRDLLKEGESALYRCRDNDSW